jgi:hypothetical protein
VAGVTFPAPVAAVTPAAAAEPRPAPPVVSDAGLARAALTALDAEPRLTDAAVLVSVIDRVAVIGGPVPTAEQSRLAADIVRRVDGIAEVRNRCFVTTKPDPLLRAVASRFPAPPRSFVPDLPGVLPGWQPTPLAELPQPATDEGLATTNPPGPVTSLRPPAADLGGVLLPPTGFRGRTVAPVPAPTAPSMIPPPAVPVPGPGVLTASPRDLLTAADAVRRGDPRFAGLRLDLRDGALVISGTVARSGDAWQLAQLVRRIPGDYRIVIGEVTVR